MTPPSSDRTYIIDDAARLMGVCRRTIYYRIKAGQLMTTKRGVTQRVTEESMRALGWTPDSQRAVGRG